MGTRYPRSGQLEQLPPGRKSGQYINWVAVHAIRGIPIGIKVCRFDNFCFKF